VGVITSVKRFCNAGVVCLRPHEAYTMKRSAPKPAKRSGAKAGAATARSGTPAATPINAKRLSQTDVSAFTIVGVGASAGGLEAFTELLTVLPLDTGMAFVLVQHLEAKHESMLAKLLSKATQIPVTEARNRTPVEPNHVYVIPANAEAIT
jgi:two-component system, chemotaxis family, CheB/CheR fusion protein